MKTAVHFSSATDDWATPPDFFAKCEAEFGPFDLDACASPENAKCAKYYTSQENGLRQLWSGRVWMNPPYGRSIKAWMRKACLAVTNCADIVVCLVPARTDAAWWHDYAAKGEVRFIRGRLRFGGSRNPAPFPSALVIFRKHNP